MVAKPVACLIKNFRPEVVADPVDVMGYMLGISLVIIYWPGLLKD